MRFLLALQFLTRFPVTIRGIVDETDMARSMAYYPAVGLILGCLAAGTNYLLNFVLPTGVCDLITLALIIFLTGNIHMDGLMDSADGLFSGKPRERVLEIMKDSRVGSHGVTAAILVLGFKFMLLGYLTQEVKLFAWVVFPVLGRWAIVYAARVYPYARAVGGIGGFTGLLGFIEILAASLTAVGVTILLLGAKGLILLLVVPAGVVVLGRYLSGKIGGITGDILGAINECTEVLALLTILLIFSY